MKKSNRKYLKDYESELITSLLYDYTRQLPLSVLIEIEKIYVDETGKSLNTNFSCTACVLRLMRQVGKLYFKDYTDHLDEDIQIKLKEKYNI